jgi:hypothetical protein
MYEEKGKWLRFIGSRDKKAQKKPPAQAGETATSYFPGELPPKYRRS